VTVQQEITQRICERIEGASVEVSIEGNRALITVVSSVFEPMNRVQKQQAVYGCIEDFIQDGRLHAVTIKALPPDRPG
jgi:acid stress-induced BolA-like protein IbaG/YrbA